MKTKFFAFILASIVLWGNPIRAQSQWIAPASTTDILNTVCFIDSLTGWVGGMLDDQQTGVIRKSTDGGSTWTQQTLPVTYPVRKIVFVSSSTGYAACYHGAILKTVDGGQTWVGKASGTTTNLQSIFFLNTQLGWACGGNAVLMTKDGGETWTSRTVPGSSPHYDIAFGNEKEGTLAGGIGEFFTTPDGGETWKQAPIQSFTYFGVAFLSPSKEIVVGDNIELSHDGGLSWQQSKSPSGLWMRSVNFADSLIGWAVGPSGILKSTDGGAHWTQQSNPSPGSMYADISTPDGVHAWTVAYHVILKIIDKQSVSFSHSTLTASPASIAPDGRSTSTITLQVKDADSLNITSSVGLVVFTTTAGTLSSVVDHNDGTYTAVLTSPMTPTSATVTASLGGTAFAATAIVQLGPSLSLSTITAAPEYIRADGLSTSTITVQLKDGVGNNLTTSAGRLVLTTTAGSLDSTIDHNNGSYTAVLRSSATGGMAIVTASLNGTALDGSATVLFTNSTSVQPPLDTTGLPPLRIGDKWFYQYVSMSERAFVVKEITDTTSEGTRIVTVTKFTPSKKTITTENWSVSQGALRVNNVSVFLSSAGDTVLNSGGRSNIRYLFNGQSLRGQKLLSTYYSHTGYSGEEYRAALGIGMYLYTSYANWGSIPQSRDTLSLLGVQLNGITYGEFSPMIMFAPPNTPVLASPADAQIIISSSVLFTWTSSGGPTSFRLQVSTGPSFSTLLVDDSLVAASSYSWNIPDANTVYYWRVAAVADMEIGNWSSVRSFTTSQSDHPADSSITSYSLGQNFPNPCNASTTISFALPTASYVRLVVWNALGEQVATLVSGELPGGVHVRQWNAEGYPSGVYYYRLQAGTYTETRRLVIVK